MINHTWTTIRCENKIFPVGRLMEKEVFLGMKKFFLLVCILSLAACKQTTSEDPNTTNVAQSAIEDTNIQVDHATGFTIEAFDGYKVLTVKNAWPGAEKEFRYALVSSDHAVPGTQGFDAVFNVPVKRVVVTSTTHIPSLEMLGIAESLIGFPNTDYISSEHTRGLVDNGNVRELGKNEDINTELLIDLAPDLVVTFAVEGDNATVSTIQKTGIPVVYNSDWTETTPLGKAEWIKFFGVLFQKEREADSIFARIEADYLKAKELAAKTSTYPTVLSGAMYKDVWYLPQGDSWAAQFIKDANGTYLWADSEGTGSISLNLEAVLEKGQQADYWIGPGSFTSLDQLTEAHEVYTQFDAFTAKNVFSFTNKKGATGGVLYYELAPNRPDLVLKDIIKIIHPELLPEHELFFFSKLQ